MNAAPCNGLKTISYMNRENGTPFLSVTPIDPLSQTQLPISRRDYRILITKTGSCDCQVDKMPVTANSTSLIFAKQNAHFSISPEPGTTGMVISFSMQFLQTLTGAAPKLQRLPVQLNQAKQLTLQQAELEQLTTLVENLADELDRDYGNTKSAIIHALFQIFAFEISRLLTKQSPLKMARFNPLIMRFYLLLEEHFASFKQPFQYANLMYITPTQLNSIAKTALGCTASTIIQERIVSEAKTLILHSDLSMKEVAYKLGFEDLSHFSRFFKKVAGTSFTDFRKENQQFN